MKTFWGLNLVQPESGWQELEPWPGPERMLAVPAAAQSSFFLISGTRLDPGPDGKPVREYLSDAYRFTPGHGWNHRRLPARLWRPPRRRRSAENRRCSSSVATMARKCISARRRNIRVLAAILAYSTNSESWAPVGTLPFSRATVPLVSWRGVYVVCNGEVRPGVRSPEGVGGGGVACREASAFSAMALGHRAHAPGSWADTC